MIYRLIASMGFMVFFVGCAGVVKDTSVERAPVDLDPNAYVLKVNTTCQDYNFIQPWLKNRPYSRSGMGIMINDGQVLIAASLIRNHNYIELETVAEGKKVPAKLVHVDYSANLALVEPINKDFLKSMKSLKVVEKLAIGDKAQVWQFEDNGTAVKTECELKRVDVGFNLLQYQFKSTLPSHLLSPAGLPIVFDGKLSGIMTSYNSSVNTVYAVSSQVINHFLRDMRQGGYQGFPTIGFGYSLLDDPQLLDYIKLPKNRHGVYVTYVRPKSSAADAGMKKGDVIFGIDEFELDRKGKYVDPDYGPLHFFNLLTTKSFAGTKRVLHVWRDAKEMTLTTTLKYVPVDTYPVPPYLYDRGPDYVFVGGLVIQELSRQYLYSWKNWKKNAPQRLVNYDRIQWEVAKPGYRPVIISIVIPAPGNQGLEDFGFKRIKTINSITINNLRDVQRALKTPITKNGKKFHYFTFFYRPLEMMLELESAAKDERLLKVRYQIPAFEHFH